MSKPFQFKQFIINQDRCAMKIGTDGVLLGAWSTIAHNPMSILDIGAGTGVISLMLAQRSIAQIIDAIEIDADAYEQCVENFEVSQWNDRLFCYHASLEEFVEEIDDKYDLVVSNPPFFSGNYKSTSASRDIARFQDALPFEVLITSVKYLLSESGKFCVVIPYQSEFVFKEIASKNNLFPNNIMRVKGSSKSKIKRSFIEFSSDKTPIQESNLIIETSRHQYTEKYISLTKDFYLNL